jgi:hypothetical protein
MAKQKYIAAFIPPAHYRAIKKKAKEEERTVSFILREIIADSLAKGKKNVKKAA